MSDDLIIADGREIIMSREFDTDGKLHHRLIGEFPKTAAFDPHLLRQSNPDVLGVTLIVTVNLDNAAATYVWRNDADKSDHGAFVMRRVTAWNKEATDGTE